VPSSRCMVRPSPSLNPLSEAWIYCLKLESIIWSLNLLSEAWIYCLKLESIVRSLKLLSEAWNYCLMYVAQVLTSNVKGLMYQCILCRG
jgi:hypothetical protein